MKYTYENLEYEKRGITDNVLVKVIGNDYEPVIRKDAAYTEKAASLKYAELTSQMDSCPIVGREELRPLLAALREHIPGLRARQTQMGTAVATTVLSEVRAEDAQFQIANGSIAHVSVKYDGDSEKVLLAHGILPIITEELLPAGSYLFLENIRESLKKGGGEVKAYLVKEKLEPVLVWVPAGDEGVFEAVWKG